MEKKGQGWTLTRTPEEAENAMIALFAQVYSKTIEIFAEKYGSSAFELAKEAFIQSMVEPIENGTLTFEKRDLDTFIAWLISGICVGHQGEFLEKTGENVRFRFTSCPYATIFRQAGKEKIGKFFCDADGPLLAAFNDQLKFERRHTLMDGDDHCDHHYTAPAK